ncbi:hypothetical protein CHS0354_042997 [Potamilus streckersoni]|uniref:Uncharacterized protein n=1 Tax=Potamilus streckersoni TaxID=2493646 RepID=A0AAE0W7K8_9BIVA|nr:hypothetical protein CHS0354_042997 [Potamilus streckersoni]
MSRDKDSCSKRTVYVPRIFVEEKMHGIVFKDIISSFAAKYALIGLTIIVYTPYDAKVEMLLLCT